MSLIVATLHYVDLFQNDIIMIWLIKCHTYINLCGSMDYLILKTLVCEYLKMFVYLSYNITVIVA